jgi:hypothetical protein
VARDALVLVLCAALALGAAWLGARAVPRYKGRIVTIVPTTTTEPESA